MRSERRCGFDSKSFIQDQKRVKSQQEIIWGNKLAEVNQITDRLGKGIDDKIKESVATFLVHDFVTSGSCEGGINEEGEKRHGVPYPWVEVYAPAPEGLGNTEGEEKEGLEREWMIKNFEQQQKTMGFLEEFYKGRETPFDTRLVFSEVGVFGGFRVQSFGAAMTVILTPEERKQKFTLYQKETEDFGKFLKDKYFFEK